MCSAVSVWAQAQVGTLSVTQPTFTAIDTDASGTRWLYVSQHGEVRTDGTVPTNGGIVWKYNLTTPSAAPVALTTHGTGNGQFISPDGIAVDPTTHDLFVSDRYLSRIQRLHNDGTYVMQFGTPTVGGTNEMHGPCGLAIDASGALYVAEHGDTVTPPFGAGGSHVSKYTISGSTVTQAWRVGSPGGAPGEFGNTGPYGIAVNGGNVYVSDGYNARVQVLAASNGAYQSLFGVPNTFPVGVLIDSGNNLWLAESSLDSSGQPLGPIQQVQKLSLAGASLGVTLSGGLSLPFHTSIDTVTNKAYVTDYNNSRVVIFDLSAAAPTTPVINSASSVSGNVGAALTYTITATNSPTSFALATGSTLPAGLALNGTTGVISGTPSATGTTTVQVTATNASGTSAPFSLTFNIGAAASTAPVVTSFGYVAHTLHAEIVFSEPVSGVDLSDFTFTITGPVHGTMDSVTKVNDSTYDVNFTWIDGAPGTFAFALKTTGTGITGLSSGQAYAGGGVTLCVVPVSSSHDNTIPTVTSFVPGTASGSTVPFLVTFNRAIWNVQPANFTVNASGVTAQISSPIEPTDDSGTIYQVPVTYTGANGTISVTVHGGTIEDGNGDMYVGPDTSTVYTIGTGATGTAPAITSANTATATVGSPFSYTITATGSTPITFSATNLTGTGLALNGSTGVISGTPSTAGSIVTQLGATNSVGAATPVTLTITVNAASSTTPVINSAATASGVVGSAFSYNITATNSPTSFALAAGSTLPAGLALNGTTGAITGTPSASGSTTVNVTATNVSGTSAPFALTISIASAPSSTGLGPQITGFALDATHTATTAAFDVTFSENVTGVDATDFVLHTQGTATATISSVTPGADAAHYVVAFTYGGSDGSVQMAIKTSGTGITGASGNYLGLGLNASPVITVNAVPPADATAPTVTAFTAGTPSGQSVAFTLTFSEPVTGVAKADFVVGVSTGMTASIGTIAANSTGTTYTIPVTTTGSGAVQLAIVGGASTNVADAAGNWMLASAASTVATIGGSAPAVPVINSAATASGTVGTAFSYQITATNSPTSFALATGSTLAAGLALNGTTGAITGTPSAAGTATVNLTATNAAGTSAPFALTITIASSTGTGGSVPVINSAASASGTVGAAFNYAITATNSPTSFALVTGSTLPAGLALNGTTGVISGTPSAAGTSTVKLTATNATGTSAQFTLTITIASSTGTGGSVPVINSAVNATGTVGTTFGYAIMATNSPTSFALASGTLPAGLALNGTTGFISGTPTAAGTSTVKLTASNAAGTSAQFTLWITINAATGGGSGGSGSSGSAPVVTGTIINGAVGTPLTPVTIAATNSPTSFSISGQPAGVTISANGTISGTPTTGGLQTATVTATNSAGSGSAIVSFVISGSTSGGSTGGGTGGSTGSTGGSTGGGGGVITPPTLKSQTVTFVIPTGALIVNQSVQLGATATSNGPIVYAIVSGNGTISGNTLTFTDTNPVVVKATQAGDATWAAASAQQTFQASKAEQAIHAQTTNSVAANATINLSATADSGLPVSYTLVSGPASLNGSTLTFNGATGTVIVRASQHGDANYNAAADLDLTFTVTALGQQVYFGKLGGDDFALAVAQDNTSGTFLLRVSATGEALVAKFTLNANGSFSATATPVVPSSSGASAAAVTRTVSGMITNGSVVGSVSGLGNFTATIQPASGTTVSNAGLYTTAIPGSASGNAYLVVGPSGQVYALVVTPTITASGTGAVTANGGVNVTMNGGANVIATINPTTSAVTGSVKLSNSVTAPIAGISAATKPTDRLVNISSRLRVSGVDATHASIAGFVVTGDAPKQILIRGIGPGLSNYGVSTGLADPTLKLFDSSGKVIATNTGWNNDAKIAAAGDSVGAFKLDAGSKDSALLVTLPPGAYTAQVTSNNNGTALIEVYDVAANATVPTKQLVNISSRGYVGSGDDVLIGGFVVTGNEPKRVLIRAVGPGLTDFGVTGTLSDPVLTVYDAKGQVVAKNDNWGTAQPIDSTQMAASAADITAADTATGAFALASGSKDAAVVITLNPGLYSAIVTGANGSTGAALVEIYEIPNP